MSTTRRTFLQGLGMAGLLPLIGGSVVQDITTLELEDPATNRVIEQATGEPVGRLFVARELPRPVRGLTGWVQEVRMDFPGLGFSTPDVPWRQYVHHDVPEVTLKFWGVWDDTSFLEEGRPTTVDRAIAALQRNKRVRLHIEVLDP